MRNKETQEQARAMQELMERGKQERTEFAHDSNAKDDPKCVATGKKWIKTDEERKWDVQYELDRPFIEVLRERIDKLPDDERTKLYEAIDRGNPSDEVLTLSMRIVLGIFKDAYEHSPEAFAEAMGWQKTIKPSNNGSK